MQLVILALLGCCALAANSASISDTTTVARSSANGDDRSDDLSDVELSPEDYTVRDKRSGSGGFLAGIGSAILGKVAQASGGLSSGSSDSRGNGHQYESVEYGPPVYGQHNNEQNFDIWSFKRAILNTLFQALKAIGGGVIALKGKLIQGGGVVISAKGNLINAKGQAISTLGRQIAASAILTPPKTSNSYVYEAPAVHVSSGHDSYGGHSPLSYNTHGGYVGSASSDSYGHSAYASPSDDADHPGLLIVKSASQQSAPSNQHPVLAALSQSFGSGQKGSALGGIIGRLAGASNSNGPLQSIGKLQASNEGHVDVGHSVEHVEHVEHGEHHPAPSYVSHSGVVQSHGETHVVHDEGVSAGIQSDEGKLHGSSLLAHTPIELPLQQQHGDNHQQHYQQHHESQNLGFRTVQGPEPHHLSHTDYVPIGNGPLMFSMPLEIPVLPSHSSQPNYYPAHNQIPDFNTGHNSYGQGLIKRSSRPDFRSPEVRAVPSIGYSLKNSRFYRI